MMSRMVALLIGQAVRVPQQWWALSYMTLILMTMVGIINLNATPVLADHRAGSDWHQTKMHSSASSQKENVCVQVGNDSVNHVSHADFRSNIRGKLYIDNPNEDWDLLANNKIYLDLPLVNNAVQPCSGFPNRSSIPIELYMSHNTTTKDANWFYANACGQNVACAKNDVSVWNSTVGHYDRRDSFIWFPEQTVYDDLDDGGHDWENNEQRSYVISHEFGHVFGLADGGGDKCNQSIMHAGKSGCGISIFWPQQIDRTAVENIANNP